MGLVNKKQKKEENDDDDDDDDQWSDEIDQSLKNYDDTAHTLVQSWWIQLERRFPNQFLGKRVLTKDQRTVRRSRCPESTKTFEGALKFV